MEIKEVSVTYGELRSTGYPSFSNRRVEISLSAEISPGETAREVKDKLLDRCKCYVLEQFNEKPTSSEDPCEVPRNQGMLFS